MNKDGIKAGKFNLKPWIDSNCLFFKKTDLMIHLSPLKIVVFVWWFQWINI